MQQHEDPHLTVMGWVLLRAQGDPARFEMLADRRDAGLVDALAEMLIGVMVNDLHLDPCEVMQTWQRQRLQHLTKQAKDHHDH